MEVLSATLLLLLVMDPLGNVPVFLSATKALPPARSRAVILRECVIALVLLVGALVAGDPVLRMLGLGGPALAIAGGIVLFLISIHMVFPRQGEDPFSDPSLGGEPPWVVPLAVPLIAGPGTIATLLLMAAQSPGRMGWHALALGCAWLVSTAVLAVAPWLGVLLRPQGLAAVGRLSGMVLSAVSVQMVLDGLARWLGGLNAGGAS